MGEGKVEMRLRIYAGSSEPSLLVNVPKSLALAHMVNGNFDREGLRPGDATHDALFPNYFKFGIFCQGFMMRSSMKIKPLQNEEITVMFTDVGKSCPSREFLTWQMRLLMIFVKIKFSRKFPNLQYTVIPDPSTVFTFVSSSFVIFLLLSNNVNTFLRKSCKIEIEFYFLNGSISCKV